LEGWDSGQDGAEIDIRRIIRCVNKEQWQKIGIYIIMCQEKYMCRRGLEERMRIN
jgi:hypothetical protein